MICLLLALCLCLGLAACGGTPAQDNSNNGGTTEPDGQNTADNSTEPQLSGKVTVYMPSPAGLADDLAAAFTEKTGVEVEQFQGTTGEILARLEADQEARMTTSATGLACPASRRARISPVVPWN